jgi:hypothetical protein
MKIKITNSRNNTLLSSSASAQVSVNLNIGTELLGTHMNLGKIMDILILNITLPDIECYYDVRRQQFILMEEEVRSRYLPREYRNYDMNLCYKVAF